jgi:hypothetical protein
MKKEALLSGAEDTPNSSTWGTEEGIGFGSVYSLSLNTTPRPCDAMAVVVLAGWVY